MAGHELHSHLEKLHMLCRICGQKCQSHKDKRKKPLRVANHATELLLAYGVNVEGDNNNIHSMHVCRPCMARVYRIRQSGLTPKLIDITQSILRKSQSLWSPFQSDVSEEECAICSHLKTLRGRPKTSDCRIDVTLDKRPDYSCVTSTPVHSSCVPSSLLASSSSSSSLSSSSSSAAAAVATAVSGICSSSSDCVMSHHHNCDSETVTHDRSIGTMSLDLVRESMWYDCSLVNVLHECSSENVPHESSFENMSYDCSSVNMSYECSSENVPHESSFENMSYDCSSVNMSYECSSENVPHENSFENKSYDCSSVNMSYECSSENVPHENSFENMSYDCSSVNMSYECSSENVPHENSFENMSYDCSSVNMSYECSSVNTSYECSFENVPQESSFENMSYDCSSVNMSYECSSENVPHECSPENVPHECSYENVPHECSSENVPHESSCENMYYDSSPDNISYNCSSENMSFSSENMPYECSTEANFTDLSIENVSNNCSPSPSFTRVTSQCLSTSNVTSVANPFISHTMPNQDTSSVSGNVFLPSVVPKNSTDCLRTLPDSNRNTNFDIQASSVIPNMSSNVDSGDHSSQQFMSAVTLDSTIAEILNRVGPLSKIEEELKSSLINRDLTHSEDKKTIRVKTGGQPNFFTKVKKPRKTSICASSPLKKKRARALSYIRKKMCGSANVGEECQRSSELKLLPLKKRTRVCSAAGIAHRTRVSKKFGLAIKSQLGLTWVQYRKQKRFLKMAGVSFESEKKERFEMECLLPSLSETVLTGSSRFTVVHIKDLSSFVDSLLNRYCSANLLTWHDENIPENEIWLKVGGDYGKKSFKLALEIINLKNPNSPDNTYPILMANVKDTKENLSAILNHFQQQIHNVQKLKWSGKNIRLFLFGDYDFLCKVYGHQGAKATYPCLWCHATASSVKEHKYTNPSKRSLDTIKQDYANFKESGNNTTLNGKHHNNITMQPLLEIPIDHVVPPYLHILLGIIKKHHDLLEVKCNETDKLLATEKVKNFSRTSDCSNSFNDYINSAIDLEERKMSLEGQIVFSTLTPSELQNLNCEISDLQDSIDEMQGKFPEFEGPLCSTLNEVLDQHRIVRQAYHSNSFIGNHCHKYLQERFMQTLTEKLKQKVTQQSRNQGTIASIIGITEEYDTVISQYRKVHQQLSHKNPIQKTDVDKIQHDISEYIRLFLRKHKTIPLIPKQHLLEFHCPEWVSRFGFGMAMHGEQGGEQLHASLNKIKRASRGILREGDRLQYILRTAIAKNAPELQSEIPLTKRRKKHVSKST